MAKRIKSAIKKHRSSERNRIRNNKVKSTMRTFVKKVELSIDNEPEKAKDIIKFAISNIDKAVSKGVIHKNTASRKKSRLMKKLNKAVATSAS